MQFERRKDGGGTASGYSRKNMEQQILATRGFESLAVAHSSRHHLRHVCCHRSRRCRHPGGLRAGWRAICCYRATPPLPRHHGQRQGAGAGEGDRWVATAAKPSTDGSQALPEGEGGCPCKVSSFAAACIGAIRRRPSSGGLGPFQPASPVITLLVVLASAVTWWWQRRGDGAPRRAAESTSNRPAGV
jgi:hypothetical protein